MAVRLDEAFKGRDVLRLFSFAVPGSEMTPKVYDFFRPTEWFIVSVPDKFFGEGMEMATIRKKRFVEPSPRTCYHVTPVANQRSIEANGLMPGYKLNKQGRAKLFADSPYYIYASLTETDARDWCRRF